MGGCFYLKKLICIVIILCLFPVNAFGVEVSAKSAVLIEQSTGEILYEKNANQRLPMASTPKIMTWYVAICESNLNDDVKISHTAASVEGSKMYLAGGEVLKMSDLLYGLMLNSGNDAAIAIAEHISGSVEQFADLMNEYAKNMGLRDTHFTNPNGLHDDNHYTTAYELAKMTAVAFNNPTFAEIVGTKSKVVQQTDSHTTKYLTNHNKMLRLYRGADGVKTGFTKTAGRTLVSSATRDGMQLIAVTLNAPSDWSDHTKLLDYGFENYHKRTVCAKDTVLQTVPVRNGSEPETEVYLSQDITVFEHQGNEKQYETVLELPESLPAPLSSGDVVGKLYLKDNGNIIGQSDLCVKSTVLKVETKNFSTNFNKIMKCLLLYCNKQNIIVE